MKRRAMLCVGLLALAASSAQAKNCQLLNGFVKLTPNDACLAAKIYEDNKLYLPFLGLFGIPYTCFDVEVKGTLKGKGHAGMTMEGVVGQLPESEATSSPAAMAEPGVPPSFPYGVTRQFFTARSWIQFKEGAIFTADAGVIGNGAATEQLIITGGTGIYEKATGTIYSFKSVIGEWGPYQGEICFNK